MRLGKRKFSIAGLVALIGTIALLVTACGGTTTSGPGDKAPDFKVKSDEGKDVSLSDFRGKRVILFFFPKANTSG